MKVEEELWLDLLIWKPRVPFRKRNEKATLTLKNSAVGFWHACYFINFFSSEIDDRTDLIMILSGDKMDWILLKGLDWHFSHATPQEVKKIAKF